MRDTVHKKIIAAISAIIILGGVTMALAGLFTKKYLNDYAANTPTMRIEEYFNGPIQGWGIIQDRAGNVLRRFDVSMIGEWQGDKGILREQFKYDDGENQNRVWTIEKLSQNTYRGTAPDIIGEASGAVAGNAAQWNYTMDIPVDGKKYRIYFDDWMFLMNDGVLVNRSYLKKFGFTVAELTIFMKKM